MGAVLVPICNFTSPKINENTLVFALICHDNLQIFVPCGEIPVCEDPHISLVLQRRPERPAPPKPRASPWVRAMRSQRPKRAKATMRQAGLCPCRANLPTSMPPGRRPGLCACWPFWPFLRWVLFVLRFMLSHPFFKAFSNLLPLSGY